jgi:hypothetical protein
VHDPAFSVSQSDDTNKWRFFNVEKVLAKITILTTLRTLQGKEVWDKSFSQLYTDLDGGFMQ